MEIKQIEPAKVITHLYGHEIEVIVTKSTHPEFLIRLFDMADTIDILDLDDIVKGLYSNECSGDFNSTTRIYMEGDSEESIIKSVGNWRIIPDYNQWRRVFRWWYSHDFNEALSSDDFVGCYGKWKGQHYFDKWASFERNIPQMIGYLGDNIKEGRAFLDMVMQKVRQYENRINQES